MTLNLRQCISLRDVVTISLYFYTRARLTGYSTVIRSQLTGYKKSVTIPSLVEKTLPIILSLYRTSLLSHLSPVTSVTHHFLHEQRKDQSNGSSIHFISQFYFFVAVQCPVYPTVQHAAPNDPGRLAGKNVTYTCTVNYFFPDDSTEKNSTCDSITGAWSPAPVDCAGQKVATHAVL